MALGGWVDATRLLAPRGLGEHAEHDARTADGDDRVGFEHGLFHGCAVQLGAVRGAEAAHPRAAAVPLHLGVATRSARVVEGHVGLAAPADDGAALEDGVALAVDVEHGGPGDLALHVAR